MWPKDVAMFKGALSFILCSRRVVTLFRVLPGRGGQAVLGVSTPVRRQTRNDGWQLTSLRVLSDEAQGLAVPGKRRLDLLHNTTRDFVHVLEETNHAKQSPL